MTEPLPDIDPRRTHAVLVGAEQYATRHNPLPGAAADALGHARWLTENGVPADHIHLCVSPLDAARTEEEARHLGITRLRTATESDVRDALVSLHGQQADLLWFAWSGHGVHLPPDGVELLPYADGSWALDTKSLRDSLLHDPGYDGIARKVLLIDACRLVPPSTAMAHGHGINSFPNTVPRPRPPTLLIALKATQAGSAAYSGSEGGLFTRTLLDQLRDHQAWPPDLTHVAEAVRAALRAEGSQSISIDDEHWTGPRLRPTPSVNRPDWLRTHDEALTRLGAKGRFLTDNGLPYLPPDPRHKASPDRILADLTGSSDSTGFGAPLRGVLLTGPAGVGKTRTCFEIAQRALSKKWQVFHPQRDAGLNAEQLLDGVREAVGPEGQVLLVLDYLDRYGNLDLADLNALLHTEAEHGLRIACVASVRPGALETLGNRGYRDLFTRVELRNDDEREQAVAQRIFEKVAENALGILGDEKMAALCSTRPILALLLALELERLADARRLDPSATDAPRPDTLIGWFVNRTGEEFGAASDRAELLAAAAATLACVHTRDAVEQAADTLLHHHTNTPGVTGAWVVARLKSHGWLVTAAEQPEETLDTFHDIVTDLFLSQTCLPDHYTFAPDIPPQFLNALRGDIRSLHRAVEHLDRWGSDLEDTHHRELARACATWLGANTATVLGLFRDNPVEGMSTLLAMISATPWRRAVVDRWHTLVTPWLEGADPTRIRTFLTGAALNCGRAPTALLEAAQEWLDRHADQDPDAIHLINALARATIGPDRPTDDYERYVAAPARTWLDRHGTTREGRVRLRTLLRHTGHRPDIAAHAAHTAVQLADDLSQELATGRLLTTLHRTEHIPATDRARLAKATHEWLTKYGTHDQATYLYTAALPSPHLPRVDPIAAFALTWLHCRSDSTDASYVLKALLKTPDLHPDTVGRTVRYAHTWLSDPKNGLDDDASFVLAPLLHEATLTAAPESAPDSVAAALAWLERHPLLPTATFVLRHLLKYRDSTTTDPDHPSVTDIAVSATFTWLTANRTWDRQLLGPFIARTSDMHQEQRQKAAEAVLARMPTTPDTDLDDSFVLQELLRMNGLRGDQQDDILRHARTWLEAHPQDPQASFVIAPYLYRVLHGQNSDAVKAGVDRALRWLAKNGDSDRAVYVLDALRSARKTVPDDLDTTTLTRLTLHWVRACPTHDKALPVLEKALRKADELGDDGARAVLEAVQARLAARDRTQETADEENSLLDLLLSTSLKYPDIWPPAARCARNRLDLDHPLPSDNRVLRRLLAHCADDENPDPDLVRAALDWLKAYAPNERAGNLLVALLDLRNPPHGTRLATIEHSMNQLRSPHGTSQTAGYLLEHLLISLRRTPPPHPDVLPVALAWLREHAPRRRAKHVLRTLAAYDSAAPRHPDVRTQADRWLAAHPDATEDIQTSLAAYLPPT
ncbi:caspase family protein [Streptomyces sp. NL15-2K]|uniref:caspase family protein n=1 Tax=Streptomyces sp. NL15-2K TaxID=376149 RepID=UPI000FF9692D|nr:MULTISPECIES: caspase family protein [Actinomycetes]WKX09832.1 caspase family protein [Kutzneria buriramensis]GCB48629.1 hypothetical protein SNL152K_5955 [Streptomyces sp. NL15-2K]